MMMSKEVSAIPLTRPAGFRSNARSLHREISHYDRSNRASLSLIAAAHTTIITGFSISVLNAPISSAPSAPSTAR